jgi:multiple sugar transport system substrate-binding protein
LTYKNKAWLTEVLYIEKGIMKRLLSLFTLVFLASAVFAGCSKNPQANNGSKEGDQKVVVDQSGIKYADFIVSNPKGPANKTRITYATHWSDYQTDGIMENGQVKQKGLKQYLEEYVQLHPNIEFQVKEIPFTEYASKIQVMHDAGVDPDIYQVYSAWGVSYIKKGLFDAPPADIEADIRKNYVSTAGVTVDGKIWGIPTEINDYVLVYNKKLLKEAGFNNPPKTWDEFVNMAVKSTKKDAQGHITQYGVAFGRGDEGQSVDPFLSFLFSNGGKYLSEDNSKALFNDAVGVDTLEKEVELFRKGATDLDGNFWDIGSGKVVFGIAAPWTKKRVGQNYGAQFADNIGVVPLPAMKKSATLQYSWFMGVTNGSQHKKEAWEFLKWISADVQPATQTTRYGDLLTQAISAIPSRKTDIDHQPALKDFFTSVFVKELKHGVAEPNVLDSSQMKTVLMKQIEAAWAGNKTPKQALDSAATEINGILAANKSRGQ